MQRLRARIFVPQVPVSPMTKFTITADLHLDEENADDGLDVLRWICRRTRESDAEALLVAGDLFDSPAQGRTLVSRVQSAFQEELGGSTSVVMVPGNHDENLGDLGWQPPVTVLGEGDTSTLFPGDDPLVVHGLPYLRGRSLYEPAPVTREGGEHHLLLTHASYRTERHAGLLEKLLEHNEENAFLLHEDDFADSGFDHVLLGHWHDHQPLGGNPPATYVGAPIPASRRETGPKTLLEGTVTSNDLQFETVPVESPPGWFHEVRRRTVVPGHEDAALDDLQRILPDPDPGCVLLLEVEGYTSEDPASFRRRLEDWRADHAGEFREVRLETELQRAEALEAPLLQRLLEALEETPPDERLSVGEIVREDEPDRVHDLARTMLEEDPGPLVQRARRLLLEAVCEVMDA